MNNVIVLLFVWISFSPET